MRTILGICAMVAGLAVAVPSAEALSEWWAPNGKKCPAFDSEEACEAWCAEDDSRCGGSAQCNFQTGTDVPMCNVAAD